MSSCTGRSSLHEIPSPRVEGSVGLPRRFSRVVMVVVRRPTSGSRHLSCLSSSRPSLWVQLVRSGLEGNPSQPFCLGWWQHVNRAFKHKLISKRKLNSVLATHTVDVDVEIPSAIAVGDLPSSPSPPSIFSGPFVSVEDLTNCLGSVLLLIVC